MIGGDYNPKTRYIDPTVIFDPPDNSPLWKTEIYGPILVVKPVGTLEEVLEHVGQFSAPQSVYLFTQSKGLKEVIQFNIPSGSLIVNDAALQVS